MATHLPHLSQQSQKSQSFRRRVVAGFALTIAAGSLAPTFGASSSTWDRLAQCESGQRWDINTGNGYYGGLQFSAGTWLAYGGGEFAPKAHKATRKEQITVAERLLADRGWGPWPSCSTKLKLTAADALGNPFPALPVPPPTSVDPPAPPHLDPSTTAPPTADAAAVLAKAERKATNTAARVMKKRAKADHLHARAARAIRHARHAPADQQQARAAKIARLQAKATRVEVAYAKAVVRADRAARKLHSARAAAGLAP